ncbi:hypothetical protein IC611_10515 [Proteus mirabilis]
MALTIGTGGMATPPVRAIFAGAGLAAGFTIGGLIDDAADWVADGIDSLFGLSNLMVKSILARKMYVSKAREPLAQRENYRHPYY